TADSVIDGVKQRHHDLLHAQPLRLQSGVHRFAAGLRRSTRSRHGGDHHRNRLRRADQRNEGRTPMNTVKTPDAPSGQRRTSHNRASDAAASRQRRLYTAANPKKNATLTFVTGLFTVYCLLPLVWLLINATKSQTDF